MLGLMRRGSSACLLLGLLSCSGGGDAAGTGGSTGTTSVTTAPTSEATSPTASGEVETLAATTYGVFVPDLPLAVECEGRELGACEDHKSWCSGPSMVAEVCAPTMLGGPVAYRPLLTECICVDPMAIRIVDLDEDGVDDVAIACREDRVVAWFGGTGRPMACPDMRAATAPSGFAVVDVDLDGQLDMVTLDYAGKLVSVVRGLGGRDFAGQYVVEVEGAASAELDAADLDGDGDTDLVARGTVETRVLLADGAGGFAAGQGRDLAPGCMHGALVDLDGDGRLDLPNYCNAVGLSWHAGVGDATFAEEVLVWASDETPYSFEIADVDGDDWLDLLLLNGEGPRLARGEGSLMFSEVVAIGPAIGALEARAVDLDGEPPLELLLFGDDLHDDELPGLWLLVGDGLGGFELAGMVPIATRFTDLRVGDFTGDGQVDIVATSYVTSAYNSATYLLESAP